MIWVAYTGLPFISAEGNKFCVVATQKDFDIFD